MNNKIKIGVFVFAFIAIIAISIYLFVFEKHNEELLMIAIYPTGTLGDTYYFAVKKDATLECNYGERVNDNIMTEPYLATTSEKITVQLTEDDFKRILNQANELRNSGYDNPKQMVLDGWNASVLYDGRTYKTDLMNSSDALNGLVDEIVRLSAIKVNMRGFA